MNNYLVCAVIVPDQASKFKLDHIYLVSENVLKCDVGKLIKPFHKKGYILIPKIIAINNQDKYYTDLNRGLEVFRRDLNVKIELLRKSCDKTVSDSDSMCDNQQIDSEDIIQA